MYFEPKQCGKRIKELRMERELTQEAFANEICINIKYVSKIETGYSTASIELLIRIADYFGVTMDYLLVGRTDKEKHNKVRKRLALAQKILRSLEKEF